MSKEKESREVVSIAEIRLENKVQGLKDILALCEYISETEQIFSFSLEDIEGYVEALEQTYKEQHSVLVANELNNIN